MKTQTIFLIAALFLMAPETSAQKYITKTGHVSFFSSTPIEDIDAHNRNVMSIVDLGTGQIVFSMQMKEFIFKKQLMQDHFNEKYVESDKYPKSLFDGKIENMPAIDLTKDAEYEVNVKGKLVIHGVTNEVTTPGKLMVKGGKLSAESKFKVRVADYKIEIPTLVVKNIAEVVDVTVEMAYEPMAAK